MSAPRLAAKGAGILAQKIKEETRVDDIPTVEKRTWLVRCIAVSIWSRNSHRTVQAVAEVLAYGLENTQRIWESLVQL